MDLPSALKSGEPARLFPTISETAKEQKAASILLAVLSAIPPFADSILGQVGQRIGKRSTVNTFTEVVFKSTDNSTKADRPDGLIQVNTSRSQWSALVETKIGGATLDKDQIERYLRIARENNINAVVTISNEFAALPTHHPLPIAKTLTRNISLYHLSWWFILTEAILIHNSSTIKDTEQAYILREFIRFFTHESAGVARFTTMPKEWSQSIDRIQAGGSTAKADALPIVRAWHQEVRDLSLLLSRKVLRNVTTRLNRAHLNDPEKRFREEVDALVEQSLLSAEVVVPDTAGGIKIVADLKNRCFRTTMTVAAPKDRKTNRARVNWLTRQLTDIDQSGVFVGVVWASRAANSVFGLGELTDNPETVDSITRNAEIRAFEITIASTNVRRFSGVRTSIEELERTTAEFYERIGQNVQEWRPRPPKAQPSTVDVDSAPATPTPPTEVEEAPRPGNRHFELLDIPAFLQR